MLDKLLRKDRLIDAGIIISVLYALVTILLYFLNCFWAIRVGWYLFGAIGAAVLLYLGREHQPIRLDPAQLLLVLFMIWYLISCIAVGLEQGGDWVSLNTQYMADTAVGMLFLFPLGCALTRNRQKLPSAKWILHAALIGWTLVMIFILIRMLQAQEIQLPNGGVITTSKGRGLKLNCNANMTGLWSMAFFIGCLYMACRMKGIVWKGIYGIGTVVHYWAMVLSGSRAAFMGSLFAFAATVGVAVWVALQERENRRRLMWTACAVVLAAAAYYLLRKPMYRLFGLIAYPGKNVRARDMLHKTDQLLSGREGLWKMVFAAMFRSPMQVIFGVTPASIGDLLMQYGAEQPTYTHNEILELIMDTGFVGFGLCLAWLILILRDSWKMYFVRKENSMLLALPMMIVALLLTNMFEAHLVFYLNVLGYVFFFIAGCIHGLDRKTIFGN